MREFTPEEKEMIVNTPITVDVFDIPKSDISCTTLNYISRLEFLRRNMQKGYQPRGIDKELDILVRQLPNSYKVVNLCAERKDICKAKHMVPETSHDWDMEFDCMNHDKWKELKVEEIRTESTETLKNALERIAELEKENAELKEQVEISYEVYNDNLDYSYHIEEQLTEAKKIIGEFVEWANWQGSKCPSFKSIQNKAEQFLKTEALAVRSPKRTQNDPDKLTDDVMNDWKEMED